MTTKEIIHSILQYEDISASSFAKKVGLHPTQIYDLQSGKTKKISGSIGNKITSAYPNYNLSWLLTGEGDMLIDGASVDTSNTQSNDDEVPLIPASAFAGGINGFAPDSISLSNCEMVVSPVKGAQFAIPITGDSMEPDYHNGSIAYIKQINETAFIPWGHVVVLDTENGAFIKAIYPDNKDEEYIWAKSINPKYPPLHIPKSSIFRIFRVLGTSRIFTTM